MVIATTRNIVSVPDTFAYVNVTRNTTGAGGDATGYAQYVTKHSQFVLPYNHATQPLTKQDRLFFRLYRDSGVANDFSGTVVVTEFEMVYQSVGIPTI